MHWLDLATGALGLVCVVVGVVLPPSATYLIPAGVGFLTLAVKQPSKWLPNDKEDK